MTERKPPGISQESWVDKQIREATERGAFENLPGAGRPLKDADAPYDENWWLKKKLRDEGEAQLPPTLALRKEVEEALRAARRAGTESEVRRIVTEINGRIRAGLARPMSGPPLNLVPYDVEQVLAEWREAREAPGERGSREG
jgi:hypothetical protein